MTTRTVGVWLGSALAVVMVAGCAVSTGVPAASSFDPVPGQTTPMDPSLTPVPGSDALAAPSGETPTCPPDTAPYDQETHTAPPADAPTADCYVPEVSGPPGPPKHPVLLPSDAP
jgi:hypothetical protein